MSFETENRKIRDIFQRSAQYIVPRYQRQYVWNNTNWSELFNDIVFAVKNEPREWSHFLGAIVLTNKTEQSRREGSGVHSGITEFEIVDGQQRLTTVYILLLCLYFRYLEFDDDQSKKRADYLYNTFITSLNQNAEPVIEIENKDYEEDIKKIVQSVRDKNFPDKGNFFYKAFEFFYNEIKKYSFAEVDLFQNKLLDINVVEIISEQDEEIYNIFEVLNARGKKLKQMELLKNHIMKYIQPRTDDFIDAAKEKWNLIIQNCETLTDEDDMLAHFCKCYIKKKAENEDSVYKLIKSEIPISELSIFLDSLVEYSNSYRSISKDNHQSELIEYFDIKNIKQIRSLLAAIEVVYRKGLIDDDIKESSILQLRNFFFRFYACSYTSNKTDGDIAEASYNIYHSETCLDYKFYMEKALMVLDEYVQSNTVSSLMFSNTTLHYSNKNTSYKRNGKLIKYILCCVYSLKQNDTYLDQNKLTIEHLLNDDGSVEHSALYNLTLTSGDINSLDLKNKGIVEKISILKEKSSVAANKELEKYITSDGIFDSESRKNDLMSIILDEVFKYNPQCFNISEENVAFYFNLKDLFSKDIELYNLLMDKGMNLEKYLISNPKENELLNRYRALVSNK